MSSFGLERHSLSGFLVFFVFFGCLLQCITWATPVTSKGTPSEVSIFSQRQRMVITSRDILRRQAGGSSRGKTVSWTTAVRNVSNQGQEEEGGVGGWGVKDTEWPPVLLVSAVLIITVPWSAAGDQTLLSDTRSITTTKHGQSCL